jgi:excisionase family DNA binding protein
VASIKKPPNEPRRGRCRDSEGDTSDLLTIPEVCALLRIPRSTFYQWRQVRSGPLAVKLPNGEVRIRRADLDEWLRGREEVMS